MIDCRCANRGSLASKVEVNPVPSLILGRSTDCRKGRFNIKNRVEYHNE